MWRREHQQYPWTEIAIRKNTTISITRRKLSRVITYQILLLRNEYLKQSTDMSYYMSFDIRRILIEWECNQCNGIKQYPYSKYSEWSWMPKFRKFGWHAVHYYYLLLAKCNPLFLRRTGSKPCCSVQIRPPVVPSGRRGQLLIYSLC